MVAFFNFPSVDSHVYICVWIYVFLMRVEKTYAQTMRSGDGALVKSLHPVVSPQASKLFSVTQILIWKSQLTELTEDRRKKKKEKGAAKIYCPSSTVLFLWASSAIRLMAFDSRQLLVLISCLLHTGCTERWGTTARAMSLFIGRKKNTVWKHNASLKFDIGSKSQRYQYMYWFSSVKVSAGSEM